jgi:hypothetical protein
MLLLKVRDTIAIAVDRLPVYDQGVRSNPRHGLGN